MKQIPLALFASVALGAVVQSSGAVAGPGASHSGGGEIEAQWFANHAILVTNYYVALCAKPNGDELLSAELPGIACEDFKAIRDIYRKVSVEFKDIVQGEDGRERDAINNGQDKITVGHKRWMVMKSQDITRRIRIALHEYATIARLESGDSYGFSGSVATQLPHSSPVQLLLDRVRFSPEYFLSLDPAAACNLAAGLQSAAWKPRLPALMGSCGVVAVGGSTFRSAHYQIVLNDQVISSTEGTSFGNAQQREAYCGAGLRELMLSGKCF